nr:GGDEF domain-containing protein [Magnetospirillum sulfuroxidans]
MGRAFSVFVLARDRAEADLALIAVTDALSGLGNRRGFDHHLQNEWRRCARDQLPLTLIMADIDHFKLYNDRYGHPQGDECIRQVGELLRRVLRRPGDFAGRYGGEEFVCILPATDHEGALSLAQAIRHDMAQLNIVHQGAPENGGRITLSIGVVTLIPTEDIPPQHLVDLADAALYQAKKSGRDRVCGTDIAGVNVESA